MFGLLSGVSKLAAVHQVQMRPIIAYSHGKTKRKGVNKCVGVVQSWRFA